VGRPGRSADPSGLRAQQAKQLKADTAEIERDAKAAGAGQASPGT